MLRMRGQEIRFFQNPRQQRTGVRLGFLEICINPVQVLSVIRVGVLGGEHPVGVYPVARIEEVRDVGASPVNRNRLRYQAVDKFLGEIIGLARTLHGNRIHRREQMDLVVARQSLLAADRRSRR